MLEAVADERSYRNAIGRLASGVSVVTCAGPAGMTATSVASVSLEPLLLLVCLENRSTTLAALCSARRFVVNVLARGQEHVAAVFASKRTPREKFAAVAYADAAGGPALDGALAWIACDVHDLVAGGDHTIVIGRVTRCDEADEAGPPLVCFRGRYG